MADVTRADVVVVGAGLAGLSAARRLHGGGCRGRGARGPRPRRRPDLLRDRGRRPDHRVRRPVGRPDPGPRSRRWSRSSVSRRSPQYSDGDNLQLTDGERCATTAPSRPATRRMAADLIDAMVELTTPGHGDRPGRALGAPAGRGAGRHDPGDLDHGPAVLRRSEELAADAEPRPLPAEPGEISLLHALFYLRSGGGVERMIGIINSAQETRITRGSQQLVAAPGRAARRPASGSTAPSTASTTPPTRSPCITRAGP